MVLFIFTVDLSKTILFVNCVKICLCSTGHVPWGNGRNP